MNLNIVSWNTQGASCHKISGVYKQFFPGDSNNIVLIQEAGVNEFPKFTTGKTHKFGEKEFICHIAEDPYAKNERCTTGMLVQTDIFDVAKVQFSTVASGENRPVVAAQINDGTKSFVLATVHAIANEARAKVEIYNIVKVLISWKTEWILMGDFNCSPESLKAMGIPKEHISHPNTATHYMGRTLDYAVFSNGFVGKVNVSVGLPGNTDLIPTSSDHFPVFCHLAI